MSNKTRHYTVVLEDGSILYRLWGGSASSLRKVLEEEGYKPTVIFHNHIIPTWVRPGSLVNQPYSITVFP